VTYPDDPYRSRYAPSGRPRQPPPAYDDYYRPAAQPPAESRQQPRARPQAGHARTASDYRPAVYEQSPQPVARERLQEQPRLRMTAAGSFWYVLGCIAVGGMYFAKVPAKKALEEAGLAEMTSAERFWYVLECLAFGGGYFAKLPVKKALTEARALGG
jgi:hypothetical protein